MMKAYTKQAVEKGLVLDGLKAVGSAVGVKASKPKIKKEMEIGVSIVNQLMDVLFTKKGIQNKKEIELAGLGLMALYNIYRGVKRKRRSSIVKGVFLTATLAAALIASKKYNKSEIVKPERLPIPPNGHQNFLTA
ncbi:hypothetical protein EZ449_09145 [Pedobacter frigidisoli]|uniref:Uncharacterized protein n=1 Tax=Pedobacter frigidisoli TaxID=2530455 RepID=A0A4R0P466_9SPHI|nr:hypothetical protein [Pedobacter frigidisoli]TCD10502.1 hypothetical protein EZ449_09145 [Pedobacter frigidisoli]